ncbi:hypothetical protein ABPG74_019663 [Tetrahymena malaccensis]
MIEINKIEDLLNHTNLETLNIDLSLADKKDTNLSGFGSVLSTMTNLSNLQIEQWDIQIYDKINDEGVFNISSALLNLVKLSTLELSFPQIQYFLFQLFVIHYFYKKYQNIFIFTQRESRISDKGALDLINNLSKLKNLTNLVLNLQSNYISQQGAYDLCSSFNKFTDLSSLTLLIWVDDHGVNGLKIGLSKLINLKQLNLRLSNNKISDEGLNSISLVLENLKNLEILKLDLSYNRINEKGIISLGIGFNNLSKLKILYLNLSNNKFNDQALSFLAINLEKLSKLQNLSLHLGMHRNVVIQHLGYTLKKLTFLYTLKIDSSFSYYFQYKYQKTNVFKLIRLVKYYFN